MELITTVTFMWNYSLEYYDVQTIDRVSHPNYHGSLSFYLTCHEIFHDRRCFYILCDIRIVYIMGCCISEDRVTITR